MADPPLPPSAGSSHRATTPRRLAYCTNVHAGETLERTLENLDTHAVAVRGQLGDGPLGIGLWLSAKAARAVRAGDGATRLAGWLAERGLEVFTINGFPHGDFHRDVVKHDVYRPAWCDEQRLAYTLDLAHVLAALVPPGGEGSISTLPVGWGPEVAAPARQAAAGVLLRRAARELAAVEASTGRLIHLDLEPEPGCLLQRSEDVVAFFRDVLLDPGDEVRLRRHLRVCHDVCHAAVMFEPQEQALGRYRAAGIAVGKVQVSSAVHAPFDELDDDGRAAVLRALTAFREPRYLHQTVERTGGAPRFHDDLPAALDAWGGVAPCEACRVHFHVPIDVETLGSDPSAAPRSTRGEIDACLRALAGHPETRHLEVETYAWEVLPAPLRVERLADGIARELRWLRDRLAKEHGGG